MIRQPLPSDPRRYAPTAIAPRRGRSAASAVAYCLLPVASLLAGCNSIRNGWLDPTIVGSFERSTTTEIRHSLTLEDAAQAVPGSEYPSPQDLEVHAIEYAISGGDLLYIEIDELRDRLTPYREPQISVSATGTINLPVLGRIQAAGLTVTELEDEISRLLVEKNILVEPDVIVRAVYLQESTYSIFGVGVSAANDAPLRAGTFPILRPDLRLLDAINQVGGLNEFVTDVYVFRHDNEWSREATHENGEQETAPEPEFGVSPGDQEESYETPPDAETADKTIQPPHDERSDLIDLVEGAEEAPPEPEEPEPNDDLLRAVDEDAADPFLYVDGEWIANPEYEGPVPGAAPLTEDRGTFDLSTSSAKWARIAGESAQRILRIPAEALRTGEPSANIYVRAGDVIRIVSGEIGVYYVMGQVNRVGPFAFNAEQITLKAAIAAAGGLSPLAWPDRCTVYRRIGQREQMIQVNLDRIFAGKDPDFVIRRGDIINVGTHPFAPFLQRIRALTLPSITSNVGYSFTYSRNFADIDSFEPRINPDNLPSAWETILQP